MVCLLQLLLFSNIMAESMVALVVLAASFLMFSALGMNRAMGLSKEEALADYIRSNKRAYDAGPGE